MNAMPGYNTDETVTLHWKARIDSRESSDFVASIAYKVLKGEIPGVPEELEDLFTMEIVTRPSGSRYVVVDFV
jgi:hypothetical protein